MSTLILLQLLAGFVLLIVGADALVRGASHIATGLGISPLIVGLTVVAVGTSSPELAVSIGAAFNGQPDLSVGNVVGSNILNVLLILGLSAVITPLIVQRQLVRLDAPILIGASLAMWLFCVDGTVQTWEGGVLVLGLVAYVVFLILQANREQGTAVEVEYDRKYGGQPRISARAWAVNGALIVGGLALLVLGSRWLVIAATVIAESLGISALIIGLTIVALGTSLPEVATSLIAALRGERDIAVGNVVGSCIFNLLGVLGLSAIAAGNGLPVNEAARNFDIPVMVAAAVACLPIFFTGRVIARWEGFLFLGYYVAYTAYLVLYTQQHDALPLYSGAMLLFVIPLTALTLGVVLWRSLRRGEQARLSEL